MRQFQLSSDDLDTDNDGVLDGADCAPTFKGVVTPPLPVGATVLLGANDASAQRKPEDVSKDMATILDTETFALAAYMHDETIRESVTLERVERGRVVLMNGDDGSVEDVVELEGVSANYFGLYGGAVDGDNVQIVDRLQQVAEFATGCSASVQHALLRFDSLG